LAIFEEKSCRIRQNPKHDSYRKRGGMEVGPELAGTGQTATESNQEVDMDMEKASADE